MDRREIEYKRDYAKWYRSLPKEEREKLKAAGLDKPEKDFACVNKANGGIEGMQLSGGGVQSSEASHYTLALIAEDYYELAHVCGQSPLEEVIEGEETEELDAAEIHQAEAARLKQDAISALLAYLFRPTNGNIPSPIEVAQKVFILCYSVRPELIAGWSLERIARCFDSSRQTFSKRLIKMDAELNLHARNHKSVQAVSLYREGTKAWWKERKQAEAKARRKEYLKNYRAANAAEIKAYQAQYRAKNRERLNAAKRDKRKN